MENDGAVSFWQLDPYFNPIRPMVNSIEEKLDKIQEKPHSNSIYSEEGRDPKAIKFLENIREPLKNLDLPKWWQDGDTLRFGQSTMYNLNDTLYVPIKNNTNIRKSKNIWNFWQN